MYLPDPVLIQNNEVQNKKVRYTIRAMAVLVAITLVLVANYGLNDHVNEKPVTNVDILQDGVHNISPVNNDLMVVCSFDRIKMKMDCHAPNEAHKFWSRNGALNFPLTFRAEGGTFLVWLLSYPTMVRIDGVMDYNRNATLQEYHFSPTTNRSTLQNIIIHGRFCRIDKPPDSDMFYLRLAGLLNLLFFLVWMLCDYYSRYRGIEHPFLFPTGRYRILMFLVLVVILYTPLTGISYCNFSNNSLEEGPCRNLDDLQQTTDGMFSGINETTEVFRMEQINMDKESLETYKAYRFEPGSAVGNFTLTLHNKQTDESGGNLNSPYVAKLLWEN